MANIKFSYLYRDGANYKNYSSVIFNNPQNIKLDSLLSLIRSKLIDENYFYANPWKLPDMHFGIWDNEIDHTWHEFENIEYTNEPTNLSLELADFIAAIRKPSV